MIKISACVITKNEEKNLPQWLSCVKKFADELIVVDTGSTDRTVELARSAGAAVYSYEWKDDFAAAKNFAIDKASGAWIVFLDADEYFTPTARNQLREDIQLVHGDNRVVALTSPLINIDIDRDNQVLSVMKQMRIFRNKPYIRYVSRIHEKLDFSCKKKYKIVDTSLTIYHTGYSSSIMDQKNQRNLEMLQKDIQLDGGEKPFHYPYLSITYYNCREYEKSQRYARKALDNRCGGLAGINIKMYDMILSSMRQLGASDEEKQKIIDEAMMAEPLHPDFVWENGAMAFYQKRYGLAEREFLRALQLFKDMEKNGVGQIESILEGKLYLLYSLLGHIYEYKGEKDKSISCYMQSLQRYSYSVDVLTNLLRLLRGEEPVKVIEFLNGIYDVDNEKELNFLQKVLVRAPRNEIYLYYCRPAVDSYEAMMAAGLYEQAATEAGRRLVRLFDQAVDSYSQGDSKELWWALLPIKWWQQLTDKMHCN